MRNQKDSGLDMVNGNMIARAGIDPSGLGEDARPGGLTKTEGMFQISGDMEESMRRKNDYL